MKTQTPAAGPVRDRIVQTAMRLFAEQGYGATSVADVAEASGLLKGNLAYYFKTKAELLDAVTNARRTGLWHELTDGLADDAPPREVIGRLLAHVAASADELAAFGCPVGSLATELGKAGDALQAPAAGLLLGLETHLRSQFARVLGGADAAACAEHLLVLLQGAAVLAQARREPAIVRRQVEGAAAWLDTVLAAAPQRRATTRPTRLVRR